MNRSALALVVALVCFSPWSAEALRASKSPIAAPTEVVNLNTGKTYSLPVSGEFKDVQLDPGTYTTDLSNVPAVSQPTGETGEGYPYTITAVTPSWRSAATTVVTFQCPCGTWSTSRFPDGARP